MSNMFIEKIARKEVNQERYQFGKKDQFYDSE